MTSLVLIGEAFGKTEAEFGRPFVGSAGQELFRILRDAGFSLPHLPYNYISAISMWSRWTSFPHPILNVFNEHPPQNDVETFYARLRDNVAIDRALPRRKFRSSNLYVREESAHHVYKLHDDLVRLRPNLIVALGATACWALGLGAGIGKLRGFVHETPYGKVLPIYHPAAVLCNWSLRPLCVLDLAKARREMEFTGIRVTEREIWTEPSVDDLWHWWEQHGKLSELLAIDIETIRRQQISEVGFASDPYHALHIPFILGTGPWENYWKTTQEEVQAWKFVHHVCTSSNPKILQNLKYDTYWLAKELHIPTLNVQHDTMQAMHAWQPELGKSLYDIGSIFLDERSWKHIRKNVEKDND